MVISSIDNFEFPQKYHLVLTVQSYNNLPAISLTGKDGDILWFQYRKKPDYVEKNHFQTL